MNMIVFLSTLFLLLLNFATAQNQEWTIITSARDTLRSCTIGRVNGDTVNVVSGNAVVILPVDSLRMMERKQGTHFWRGAGIGALTGGMIGTVVGAETYKEPTGPFAFDFRVLAAIGGGVVGVTAGFAVGGIIGAFSGGDETYDFSRETPDEKVRILRDIRRNN